MHLLCKCLIIFISGITMPPTIKKRGRPKGHQLTVIGLPAKKRKGFENKLVAFTRLHTSTKQKSEEYRMHVYVHNTTQRRPVWGMGGSLWTQIFKTRTFYFWVVFVSYCEPALRNQSYSYSFKQCLLAS